MVVILVRMDAGCVFGKANSSMQEGLDGKKAE
jgi:hypothetical protein